MAGSLRNAETHDACMDSLREKAERKSTEIEAEEERYVRLIEEEEAREARYREWKAARYVESLKLARLIFAWARRFVEDERSRRIFEALDGEPLCLHTGRYLQCRPAGYGSYAQLGIRPSGVFRYREGYKWMGFGPGSHFEFTRPEEMAGELDPRYIEEAEESMREGRVWEVIERQLAPEPGPRHG